MSTKLSTAPVSSFGGRSLLALAWLQLLRDLRAGELRLLMLAVILAVGGLTAVGFFADRLQHGLARDARQLLGGDALVASDQPMPTEFEHKAREWGLNMAHTVTFPSMGRAAQAQGGAAKLVAVKAVSSTYPLRGQLTLRADPSAAQYVAAAGPQRGSVWVDPGVLEALRLRAGDQLLLGDLALRISATIVQEPDRGAGFMNFSPRVMLHLDDLPATGLVQAASRVTYRLAISAATPQNDARVPAFVAWAQAQIKSQSLRGVRVESIENARPEMRMTLERAQSFLNLVALLAALLAAVAVVIASRDFAQRHLDACAMLRVLGQSQRAIALQYLIEFASVGLLASLGGVVLGFAVHHLFVYLLAGLVGSALPAVSAWPALFGVGVGLSLMLGFGLPPVLQLAQVPALRVMRRELGTLKPASLWVLASGALGFVALLLLVSSDAKLGLIAVGGFGAAGLVFAALSWMAVALLQRWVPESKAPRWLVLATRQVCARPAYAVLQVTALSVGLLALALLVLVRTDLISSWRDASPPDAPNRFVINVQPDQSESFQAQLRGAGVSTFDWYPMFRGRLLSINGTAVKPGDLSDERARRLVEREFNLSHSAVLPQHNTLSAGQWLPGQAHAISVEQGLADTLKLKMGDQLEFEVAGRPVSARISSLRQVDWGSMRANFYVMFPLASLPEVPVTYMAAFRSPPAGGLDQDLSREFPNITVVDISASIEQVQRVLDQVVRAVEFLFGFTLATGLVVLFAAVMATREARAHEFAVMRALGASARLLEQVQRAELLALGSLAGLLSSVSAMALGWALAWHVFEFSWNPPVWVPLAGMVTGALLALSAGWWGLRAVLRRPVLETLRAAAT